MNPKKSGFEWKQTTEVAGYWSLSIADNVEVCLEPSIFGTWMLAVYVDGELAHEEKLVLIDIIAGGPLIRMERS